MKKIKESTLGMANEELAAEEEIKSRIVESKTRQEALSRYFIKNTKSRELQRLFIQYTSAALLINGRWPSTKLLRDEWLSHLAHAIVCELDVPFMIQQDIVQLQVPVDDALLMQEVQSDADFSSIKPVRQNQKAGQHFDKMCASVCVRYATLPPSLSETSVCVTTTSSDPRKCDFPAVSVRHLGTAASRCSRWRQTEDLRKYTLEFLVKSLFNTTG